MKLSALELTSLVRSVALQCERDSQGSPLFETTESLFHKLESTIQSGDGGQRFI